MHGTERRPRLLAESRRLCEKQPTDQNSTTTAVLGMKGWRENKDRATFCKHVHLATWLSTVEQWQVLQAKTEWASAGHAAHAVDLAHLHSCSLTSLGSSGYIHVCALKPHLYPIALFDYSTYRLYILNYCQCAAQCPLQARQMVLLCNTLRGQARPKYALHNTRLV